MFLFSLFFFFQRNTLNTTKTQSECLWFSSSFRQLFFMIMAPSLQRMWISFPEKKQKLERCCTITELCSKSEICHVKLRGNFLGEDLNPFFFIRRFINHVRKQLLQSSGAASGLSCVFLDDLVLSPFYLNKFWVMMLRGLLARQVARQQHQPLSLLILPQQKRIYYKLARYYFLHHRRHL